MNTTYKENIHFHRLGIRTVAQLICELVVYLTVFLKIALRSSWLQIFPCYCLVLCFFYSIVQCTKA